jgi:2-polyprenyl-3-methyl-5-hydroxy-6-metoxy-1,4-benzoquinol methylase
MHGKRGGLIDTAAIPNPVSDEEIQKLMRKVKMVDKGFYQIVEMPTQGELNEYYKKHPHQPTYAGPYATTYSASDEEYMTGLCRRIHAWIPESAVATSKHFLDIGSTTGFCLDLFQKRGYTVKGISSQLEIIKAKHPHLKDSVIVGNVVEQVNKLVEQNQKFSVIILLHVMNRVLDPAKLLDQIKNILVEDGCLVIGVPNDFNKLQMRLVNEKKITPFWIAPPQHLSYWNIGGLKKFARKRKWKILTYTTDYPIDFDLLEDYSNYNRHKELGIYSHRKRVEVVNMLVKESVEATNEYYKGLCNLGFGRELFMFLQHRSKKSLLSP